MKKTIKKFSKTFFSGFFIFQFAVVSSLAPIIARAEETEAVESVDTSAKIEEVVKEEPVVSEETTQEEQTIEAPVSLIEEKTVQEYTRVTICHANGNGGYVLITVDDDGSYNGHMGHEGDIIPATDENGDKQITQEDCGYTPPTPSCDASQNLFVNGDFESPSVSGSWGIYPTGTSGLAWDVAWQAGSGDDTPAKAELQKIYTAKSGEQYIELDSDFDGPGGSISNESASTRISQTIATVPGQKYEISYFYSPRPGYGMSDNKVGLYIDGYPWDLSVTTNGTSNTDTVWVQKKNTFTADSASHTIIFADIGTPNSFGMFIDDVKVNCVDGGDIDVCPNMPGVQLSEKECQEEIDVCLNIEGNQATVPEGMYVDNNGNCLDDSDDEDPACDGTMWARVVVTNVSNTGVGDATDTIYLGSSSNTVSNGEWFPLSIIDSGSIDDFADVPGIAVKRKTDNKIALELFGRHPGPTSSVGSESVSGYIEFWNAFPTAQIPAGNNTGAKLEFSATSLPADSISLVGDESHFDLHVNTGADRFDTSYVYQLDENCDEDDDNTKTNTPPVITVSPEIIEVVVGSVVCDQDFIMNGVVANDAEDGLITSTIVLTGTVDCSVVGEYVLQYNVTDSGANNGTPLSAIEKTRTIRVIPVDVNCEQTNSCGGGNGDDDNNDGGGNGGGGSSSGSSSSSGGSSSRQGEVLGATDSACTQFTQYHDTGSTQSEVKALQTFLNAYMDAGLTVNGTYDWATTQAVHNFQALHWDAIIKPWLGSPSKISPNTTGRTRQMTTQALNFIINCPNDAMYLEDPQIYYKLTEIKNQKVLSDEQIAKIVALLDEAHAGLVLGDMEMGK